MAEIVVVRFRASAALSYVDAVESALGPEWGALQASFPGINIQRRIRSVTEVQLRSFAAAAVGNRGASRLLRTFEVRCPSGIDPSAVAAGLDTWANVEFAYVQPRLKPATVDYTNNPDWQYQGYLQPAPEGVNSIGAWQLSGGDGSGRTIVDIEADWSLGHRDLPGTISAALLEGWPSGVAKDLRHGLCTLGVLCAVDNTRECIGMAPKVASVLRASYIGPDTEPKDLENAILAAKAALSGIIGGVILIEVELDTTAFVPNGCVDLLPGVRDAIRTAVDAGIVVVEAAGNGNHILDVTPDANGILTLDVNSPLLFDDSGAILVGAGTWQFPHSRISRGWGSNHGSRVDVYAWGEQVTTLGDPNTTDIADGTSSAAAIIAGAVVQIQGIAINATGAPLDPWTLRTYLSDEANGTPWLNPDGLIRVMPDIVQLVKAHIPSAIPDVYSRDFPGDDGSGGPSNLSLSMSPDIIVRQSAVADPQASYGEGSGNEDNPQLSEDVVTAQDHHVYVRVRNRGGSDATNVLARVWYADSSTLLLPEFWTKIGETVIPNVLTGGALTVSNAIVWPANAIPAAGHYCFISEIVDPLLPTSAATAMADYAAFRYFIRSENNVAWRNFNVETYLPDSAMRGLWAWIGSPKGPPRRMRVDIDAALPRGASVRVKLPPDWLSKVDDPAHAKETLRDGVLRVRPNGRTVIVSGWFPGGQRARVDVEVTMPRTEVPRVGSIALRQFDPEGELGRVTWRIVPRKDKREGTGPQ